MNKHLFERCIYFNTTALARKLNSRWEIAFSKFNLPPSHGYLLRLVLEKPSLSQQSIAAELRLDKSTVTRFVTKLEQTGLLKRIDSETDQREKFIIPTKKALSIHEELERLGEELYTSVCQAVGKTNLKSFVASIARINDQL